jgi:hypothetical protein
MKPPPTITVAVNVDLARAKKWLKRDPRTYHYADCPPAVAVADLIWRTLAARQLVGEEDGVTIEANSQWISMN